MNTTSIPTPTFPMLIGGQRVATGQHFPVINPATDQTIAHVAEADDQAIQAALTCAQQGFEAWSAMAPAQRRTIMLDYANLLEHHRDRLIDLLIDETGKPYDNAEYDFGMLTTCLRYFVEEAQRLDQSVLHDPDGRFLHYTLRQPLGVAVGFLAWNFPLLNVGYKLGPALAAGCATILKPASVTPLASLEVAYLAGEAGVPDGVVNLVTSTDHAVCRPLVASEVPALVTMIGSTEAGVGVMRSACTSVKHFSVELGGNAPVLVYPDANILEAAHKTVDLKFTNSGQVCVSPNRCFVHASVYEAFIEAAAQRIDGITLGSGRGPTPRMGPLITDAARASVLQRVDSAVSDGAVVVRGGHAIDPPGYFMAPTLLREVTPAMSVAKEEVFGPVLSVIRYDDEDDEIALANASAFGLAAYVYTTDLSTGLRAARDIHAGSVCINEPHYAVQLPHGGLKQSGVGKDCSRYSLEEYLTLKRVSVLAE